MSNDNTFGIAFPPGGGSSSGAYLPLTGGTLTGTLTESQTIAATSTDGIVSSNPTAAVTGTRVQMSPRLRLTGNAWNTTTSGSETNDWIIENLPVSHVTPTYSSLNFSYQNNGGGFNNFLSISPVTGVMTFNSHTNSTYAYLNMQSNLGTGFVGSEIDFLDSAGTVGGGIAGGYVSGTIATTTLNLKSGGNNVHFALTGAGAIQQLATSNGPVGAATATAGNTTAISNTSVTANSKIFLTPTNSSAATLMAGGYYKSAQTGGSSITITFTLSAAGTETFDYLLLN